VYPRRRGTRFPLVIILLLLGAQAAGQAASSARSVDSLLQDLRRTGVDILYSSELVPSGLAERQPRPDSPPLERARLALADHGLELRAITPDRLVVVARPPPLPEPVPAPEEPMDEVSVYASRYAIGADLGGSQRLSATDIELVPGSHDDALRAVRSLPGIASNASGRPYIRGSLSEDILVQYDGITLIDPFHFKNFQSLISAIDPAVIDSVEVFSGGFPVQYGRRSGGVIDIAAPSVSSGYEHRASLSLLTAGISSIGRSESLPLEWVMSLRRSTLDMIDPVEDAFGTPQFGDSLGRVRWITDNGSWTAGWLLLDDRLRLGDAEEGDEETATARYRDEYVWLTRQQKFGDALQSRTSIVTTSADRGREGQLSQSGVASGQLDETRAFNGLDLSTDWSYRRSSTSTYTFGAAIGSTRAAYRYVRSSEFSPEVAAAFGRDTSELLEYSSSPKVVNLSVYAANRRRWDHFEAELGLRVDAQRYERNGNHSQISPRLNLRYDLRDDVRLYASAGRFTQPQHVEEWRVEEAQQRPDAAQVSIHTILGAEYEFEAGGHLGVEAYTKRWTTPVAYFDNLIDNFALLPDLAPDRVRIVPLESEASGLELRVKRPFGERLTGWGTLAWARVADDFPGGGDVRRSWDQPLSLNVGLSWSNSRATLSALGGWHRGWPRTPTSFEPLQYGLRNSRRWGNFVSLDLRGSWLWQFARGDLSVVLDVTNAFNRHNECCLSLEAAPPPATLQGEVDHWLPTIVNLGFTWRWSGPR
jgi:outer membrane receptor protein involved in Fe transport